MEGDDARKGFETIGEAASKLLARLAKQAGKTNAAGDGPLVPAGREGGANAGPPANDEFGSLDLQFGVLSNEGVERARLPQAGRTRTTEDRNGKDPMLRLVKGE